MTKSGEKKSQGPKWESRENVGTKIGFIPRKFDCYPQTIFAPTQELLKRYYKFALKIQPSLLGSINSNFREDPQISCVSKKDEREEVTK